MFKGILCLVVILACGGLGMIKSQTYSQRLTELTGLTDMLQMLRTEMSYRKDPLPAVFSRISAYKDTVAMDILWECGLRMKESLDFKQCWQEAVEIACAESCLTEGDLAIVKDLGLQLGKSDVQGQASMFSLAEAKLEGQIREATKDKESRGRMYRGLGFSIGIVIAVILI
ncbi:stage III sporulation protein AB [bacterium 210820-DFI.6.37]|nr:stage III sporulation protein AB [bacterium 210820-DFI.6.37]